MADQEEGRSPPPPRSSGAFQEDAFQADAFQTAPSSPATSSQPATPYANVTSGDQTVTPHSGSLVVEGGKPTPEVTAYKLDLEGGQSEVKGSDLGGGLTPDARDLAALRPVEAMLHDPLGEVARKERRSLLGISAIATAVGWTGVLPEKIENLGITFAAPARRALLWVFLAVVLYYTFAFIVYSFSDFLSYLYAVHRGRDELMRPRGRRLGGFGDPAEQSVDVGTPWTLARFVTPASPARGAFDFAVPLLVALIAL